MNSSTCAVKTSAGPASTRLSGVARSTRRTPWTEGLAGVDEFPGAGVVEAGVVVGCEVLREGHILSVEHVHEEGGRSRDLCCGAAVCLEGEGDDGRFCGDGGQRGRR